MVHAAERLERVDGPHDVLRAVGRLAALLRVGDTVRDQDHVVRAERERLLVGLLELVADLVVRLGQRVDEVRRAVGLAEERDLLLDVGELIREVAHERLVGRDDRRDRLRFRGEAHDADLRVDAAREELGRRVEHRRLAAGVAGFRIDGVAHLHRLGAVDEEEDAQREDQILRRLRADLSVDLDLVVDHGVGRLGEVLERCLRARREAERNRERQRGEAAHGIPVSLAAAASSTFQQSAPMFMSSYGTKYVLSTPSTSPEGGSLYVSPR